MDKFPIEEALLEVLVPCATGVLEAIDVLLEFEQPIAGLIYFESIRDPHEDVGFCICLWIGEYKIN